MVRVSIKDILPPQPHYISGYSGFVQGYKFDCGQSFGRLTHTLFLNRQNYNDTSKPVLANIYEKERDWLSSENKEIIEKKRCNDRKCKYNTNMLPGYAGHVPQQSFLCGKR